MDYPVLKLGSVGPNVVLAKKAIYKALKIVPPFITTPVFGPFFLRQVKEFQGSRNIDQSGWIGPLTWKALEPYLKPAPKLLVFPHPRSANTGRPSYLHPTGGIPGNEALDFMAPGGTTVMAPEAGVVTRISGHDPSSGTHGAGDIFGYSLYIRTAGGFFFSTHYGHVTVSLGETVKAGQKVGTVGHWPRDPGRSHTHLGFTSNSGYYTSVTHIRAVSAAPKVEPLPRV